MTLPSQIRNWLIIGLEQPVGSMNEDFYYDKKNSEFFSIVLPDQFMLDENLNVADDVTTTYTKSQENSIIDRLRRIEHNDLTIISIESIPLDERKFIMQQFVDNLTNNDSAKILQQRIYNQDYRTKFDFYFENEADELTKLNWEQHKNIFLQQKVDSFLNLNGINIDQATLWEVEANGSIAIDLTKNDSGENVNVNNIMGKKRPWWKFW